MRILVINAGSSSIKYRLFDMDTDEVEATGVVERIGQSSGVHTHKTYSHGEMVDREDNEADVPDHRIGMSLISDMLAKKDSGEGKPIRAVGHRVVHGGETFTEPTLVTDEVLDAIREFIPLAPLHNPANLTGIEVAREVFSDASQVAVFDTAFHQSIPPHAYMYALPYDLYEKDRIRKYGFHGTSHNFVSREAASCLGQERDELNIITIHLGNGSSMSAVKKGMCVDTTMGFTPLAGLMMGTRCGDLDTAITFFLEREKGMTSAEVDALLNKESGFKGLTGESDLRQVEDMREKGDQKATLALGMLGYQIRKYIGAYAAAMSGLDVIVFTAGIGENSPLVRMLATAGLDFLGVTIDREKNDVRASEILDISGKDSRVKVLVVPTNEELQIARETEQVIAKVRH